MKNNYKGIKYEYSDELAKELKEKHNIDIEEELVKILKDEIARHSSTPP